VIEQKVGALTLIVVWLGMERMLAGEAARHLGVQRSTVYRWVRRGRLSAEPVRLGQRTVFGIRLEPASTAGWAEAAG
jgi:excisionase family DNA binding protein